MVLQGVYTFPDTRDWTDQLFSSCRLVRVVQRDLDRLYAPFASPSVTFIRGPLSNHQAVQAWAEVLTDGSVPSEGL